MSSSAITAFSPPSCAAAYSPMRFPALRLSVAKVMSTVSGGSGGVSRAMTKSPSSRAREIASLTPVDIGVIRMPCCPAVIAASMASIWPWSSPSSLPEAIVMSIPFSFAAAFAPSCIATKNGLVESLVISEMAMSSSLAPDDESPLPVAASSSPPHAARASIAAATAPMSRSERVADRPLVLRIIRMSLRRSGCRRAHLTTLSRQL